MWSYLHYTYSAAPAAEYPQTRCSDLNRLEPSSAMTTAGECYSTDKLTAAYLNFLFGMTSVPLDPTTRQPETISTDSDKSVTDSVSAADSPVKILASVASAKALKVDALDSGQSMHVLLGRLDQRLHCWKTAQTLLEGGLILSAQTYPRWGIVYAGALYQLEQPALPINAQDFGGWQYPTPCVTGLSSGSGNCKKILKLEHLSDAEKRSMRAGNGGKLNPDWVEWLMGWKIGWTRLQPGDFGTRKSTDYPGSQSSATTAGNA